ncbi:MAG: phosphoribosylamine--glycine ligase [Candidatus Woesearchaeota archaeon]
MKILLVGSGARENAIIDALVAGKAEVYSYMHTLNPSIRHASQGFELGKLDDVSAIAKFADENMIEYAIIGPELPLAAGVVDELLKNGVKCVGPTKSLARLETSKSFTRELLQRHKIDVSPVFKIFEHLEGIQEFLQDLGQYVIKPDGLTGGKGVKVFGEHIMNEADALRYCQEVLETDTRVIIEEKLDGEEFSLQTLTDGESFLHFPPVQDHKRAFDDDRGSNTGGMGSYSDSNLLLPFLTQQDVKDAQLITEKVAEALKKDYGEYKGIMYGGFMKTGEGIKLIEYNARFGDPEAMNVLPILKTNFADICKAVADGHLGNIRAEFARKATVCKYVVPAGYPDEPKPGKIIVPLDSKALIYYAAVDERDGWIYTFKSRSIAFVGIGNTIAEAERIAEAAASKVQGDVFHRKDIGTEMILRKRVDHMKKIMGAGK